MDYQKRIAEMAVGQEVEGYYLLKDAAVKTSTSGKPYLTATVGDCSGTIEIKVWDYSGPIDRNAAGGVVKIRGEITEYRGARQLTVARIRKATEADSFDRAALVQVAPIDVDETMRNIRLLVDSITDADYRAVCQTLLDRKGERFAQIPAAKSVHHSFLSGLLMHTMNMLTAAELFAGLYHEVIDRSLLLAGTLLHDIAKIEEFTVSELGLVTGYSTRGQLLGHLVMGAQEVAEICKERAVPEEKAVLLQHMLLSHHGEPEFGAAVCPQCAEAELLSLIDQIDSRMEIYTETLRDVPVGEFSNRIFALEKRIYHHG